MNGVPWDICCEGVPHCLAESMVPCGVVWCGVVRRDVVWCGVVWCGVAWCGVVWCGVAWCGVVWRGVLWCGVVCCGVVWCGSIASAFASVLVCPWCPMPSFGAWTPTCGVVVSPDCARRYCPQFDALFEKLTVREHLEMYSRIKGLSEAQARRLAPSQPVGLCVVGRVSGLCRSAKVPTKGELGERGGGGGGGVRPQHG
jgi:hypothetical protein